MDGEGVGQNRPNEMKHFCDSVTKRGLGVTIVLMVFFSPSSTSSTQSDMGWLVGCG